MRFKRKAPQHDQMARSSSHAGYIKDEENTAPRGIEQARSQHLTSNWLPTISSYMSWIFSASIVWEILWLPLSPVWVTGSADEITLFTIRAINADLFIALGTLFATLVIFGTNEWPAEGYRRVCLMTIFFAWCFSAISFWGFSDNPDTLSESAAVWPGENVYLTIAAHLKWIILPAAAFWQANHATRKTT